MEASSHECLQPMFSVTVSSLEFIINLLQLEWKGFWTFSKCYLSGFLPVLRLSIQRESCLVARLVMEQCTLNILSGISFLMYFLSPADVSLNDVS